MEKHIPTNVNENNNNKKSNKKKKKGTAKAFDEEDYMSAYYKVI